MEQSSKHKKTPERPGTGVSGVNNLEDSHVENHSTNVIPFKFDQREVRTLLIEGEPWFVAADICAILGYANSRKAVQDNCREAGVTASDISSGGQMRRITFVSEGNLYRLIIKSRKEEAQRFESWVCDEVLPSIRKHGRYEDKQATMPTLVSELIGMSELNVIKGTIRDKAKGVAPAKRRSFHAAMCSRLHTRFNVPRLEMIPADQFEAACNFVAGYALEGEWIGHDRVTVDGGITLTRYETQDLYLLMSRFALMHKHKDDFLVAAKACRSEVFMTMFDQLREGAFSFRVLDRRRDEIYAAYRSFGAEGGYVAQGEAA